MQNKTLKAFIQLASEFIDYLKLHSSTLRIPDEPDQQEAVKEMVKVEQELIDFFDTTGKKFLQANPYDKTLKLIQPIFADLNKDRKYLRLTLEDYRNLRPLEARLNQLRHGNALTAEARNNLHVLKELLLRAIKLSEKEADLDSRHKTDKELASWQDKLSKL